MAAQLLALVFIFGAAQFALAAVQVALDASHGLLGIPHTAAITVAANELWLQLRRAGTVVTVALAPPARAVVGRTKLANAIVPAIEVMASIGRDFGFAARLAQVFQTSAAVACHGVAHALFIPVGGAAFFFAHGSATSQYDGHRQGQASAHKGGEGGHGKGLLKIRGKEKRKTYLAWIKPTVQGAAVRHIKAAIVIQPLGAVATRTSPLQLAHHIGARLQ